MLSIPTLPNETAATSLDMLAYGETPTETNAAQPMMVHIPNDPLNHHPDTYAAAVHGNANHISYHKVICHDSCTNLHTPTVGVEL